MGVGRSAASFAVCPYRGLAAFQPDDADRFFGRDDLVAELVERVERERVLFVIGPSGSGKSSAVRAGLIPAVVKGEIPGSERWGVALFSPSADPAKELAYQLQRAEREDGDGPGRGTTGTSPTELRAVADAICDRTGGLLIVIDQFEELFTLSSRRDQEAFVQTLAALVDPAASRVRLVMAMRADFYGVCATFPWLVRRATSNQALVGPMSRADLRKVIEEPAAAAGLQLEDGLVDTVLQDAGTDAAALPLISHAMAETWRRREGRTLTLHGYRDAGGVAGSISQTADTLYETVIDEAEREACRRLMLRLVAPGEGTPDTRRRLPADELGRDPEPELSRQVAAEMTDARLLTVDRDSIEIAHEALLAQLAAAAAAGSTRRATTCARASGSATPPPSGSREDRDPDLLYRGTPLHAARDGRPSTATRSAPTSRRSSLRAWKRPAGERARVGGGRQPFPAASSGRRRGARRAHRRGGRRVADRVRRARAVATTVRGVARHPGAGARRLGSARRRSRSRPSRWRARARTRSMRARRWSTRARRSRASSPVAGRRSGWATRRRSP